MPSIVSQIFTEIIEASIVETVQTRLPSASCLCVYSSYKHLSKLGLHIKFRYLDVKYSVCMIWTSPSIECQYN